MAFVRSASYALVIDAALAGCSAQQWYAAGQGWRQTESAKIADHAGAWPLPVERRGVARAVPARRSGDARLEKVWHDDHERRRARC